ncbi:MAG: hypothetical protein JSU94_06300 [Phycisphaerales bacterium]|nr:MAG: hypothetical protein JSU94_06300 [Phycisphaerales bacterium]
MCKNVVLLWSFVLLLSQIAAPAAFGTRVIWVSDNKDPENLDPTTGGPRDKTWTDLLEANGYMVDLSFANAEGQILDNDKIAALNAADLVIVSRNTNSGSYDDGDEVSQWNSIETPTMLLVAHLMRSSHWRWLETTSTANTTTSMRAVLPGHPIFAGVGLDANNDVAVVTSTTSVGAHTDPGNGTLIGQRADNGGVWIVTWEAGQEFYGGSGQIAGGPRMWFAAGQSGGGADGLFNLTEEGTKVFLNAVKYLAPPVPEQAHDPQPEDNGTGVEVPSATLSWKAGLNMDDPNFPNPNIVEHYLWVSEPYDVLDPVIPANPWEAAGVQQFTIPADGDSDGNVDVTASKIIGGLLKDKLYLWVVDEGLIGSSGPLETDPSMIIWGKVWSFETVKSGPVVDANSIVTWLKNGTTTVDLDGVVTDSTGDVSLIEWSVLAAPYGATVGIGNAAAADTTATFTQTGTYVLQLYARDATMQEDEVAIAINVYNDSCEAAKNHPDGYTAVEFDFNEDCEADFTDFALFAAKWLEDARLPGDSYYDAGDITVPFVQFTNPLNGSIVSGDVTITVVSYDPGVGTNDGDGMQGAGVIDFNVFDASGSEVVGWQENTAPFERTWTTAELDPVTSLPIYPNGVYTIRVTAVSDAGYQAIEEISVTVNN